MPTSPTSQERASSYDVVDSHVHLWDPVARRHAWLDDEPELDRPVLPPHLATTLDGRVAGVVLVQADCEWDEVRDETLWFEAAAAVVPVLGVVAAARLEDPAVEDHLAWLAARPLVVGVRRLLQDEPPGFVLSDALARGVDRLADHDLTFDVCVRQHQLEEVVELVRRCPRTTFVLDHAGKPDIAAGDTDAWFRSLSRLAATGRVVCKVSGLLTEAGERQAAVPEHVRRVLDTFGPERVMFGSDWPVCTTVGPWGSWFDLVERELEPYDAAERALVLGGTARRTYSLAQLVSTQVP